MGTDPFSDARSGFVKLEDMLGRLLLIIPQSIEERASTLPGSQGKTYESITADVIILDGPVTELIEEIPATIEGTFISGSVIVGQLKPKVKTHGMVLGRLGQQKARTKGFGDAWVLNPPTDADKAVARPAAAAYLEATDPFA
jgi:hypothetical protein